MPEPALTHAPGRQGVSEALRRFTEELPYERRPILEFVIKVARDTAPGTRVLDLGAGDAPYRELFGHTDYVTNDWGESAHTGAHSSDLLAPADELPVAGESFGVVLCTQVLEHVPEPAAVLAECHRVLQPGGMLALTVPLLWELHELPYDFYRYTEPGLRHLLVSAGFAEPEIAPRGDAFTTIAQLLDNARWAMGSAADGLDPRRIEAREVLSALSSELGRLAPLDVNHTMPLGYCALARRS